jgi:glutamate synthase (NADPH/NADH) small chain
VGKLCSGAYVFNDLNNKSIQIGRLQRYATHRVLELENKISRSLFTATPSVNKKVALIGAGPKSLSCGAGIYFYRIQVGDFCLQKMIILVIYN